VGVLLAIVVFGAPPAIRAAEKVTVGIG